MKTPKRRKSLQPAAAPACVSSPLDDFKVEKNGSWWLTETKIPKEAAKVRWPQRLIKGLDSAKVIAEREHDEPVAVAHFEAIKLEEIQDSNKFMRINVGDCVEVDASDEFPGHLWILEVAELFEDIEGKRKMGCQWFYKHFDTSMRVEDKGKHILPAQLKEKILFKARPEDNATFNLFLSVDCVNRKVNVVYRKPGTPIPEDCDFWWSMWHDKRYHSFVDSFLDKPLTSATYAEAGKTEGPRKLRTLELYCGCGGLSFADRRTDRVIIETKWAVDYDRSMVQTFQANYPYAHGHCIGVDEFLWLCIRWKWLVDAWKGEGEPPDESGTPMALFPGTNERKEVASIESVTLQDNGVRGRKSGQGKGPLTEDLKKEQTWLEFGLIFKGVPGKHWVKQDNMDCNSLLGPFVRKLCAIGYIPLPGEVDCIMGGPPCQGVSGLNRHGKTEEIIDDPRNRQVMAFYHTIKWFDPSFVLMENVLDIFKKQNGMYVKMAATTLLGMDYQTRTGVIAAAHQGAPQGRWRAFMWGAKSGREQLPPFPEPTHKAGFACGVPNTAKDCIVTFQSMEAFEKAHWMTFNGDILSDLPEVSTFEPRDWTFYAAKPETPMQAFLRRDPPAWQASREERARAAKEEMVSTHKDQQFKLRSLSCLPNASQAVGASYLCNKGQLGDNEPVGNRTDMFAAETVREITRKLAAQLAVKEHAFKITMDLSKSKLCQEMGEEILALNGYNFVPDEEDDEDDDCWYEEGSWVQEREIDSTEVPGNISDHRPLCLNADDYLRCSAVPTRRNANFREYGGVISHKDETCCAGHTHAASHAGGKVTMCQGGGTRTLVLTGNTAAARVDHADNGGWRGPTLEGCKTFTRIMPTGDLLCPRWCVTYKKGKSNGRHGCFGRMWWDEIQPTVVGRAEPHNLRLVHPTQSRVVTIRENARAQGFPDYFVFVGIGSKGANSWVRNNSLTARYQQLGNAVCPLVADALGRCLALAALGQAPVDKFVVTVPGKEHHAIMEAAAKAGLKSWPELAGKIPRKILKLINKFGSLSGSSGTDAAAVLNEDADDDEDEDEDEDEIPADMAAAEAMEEE